MGIKKWLFIASLLALVNIFGFHPGIGQSIQSNSYTIAKLKPVWTTGIISDSVGLAHIIVSDLNGDGKTDIATCSSGYLFVLNYTSAGIYDTTWYSDRIKCNKLAMADRDANGIKEIYVSTTDYRVIVVNSANYQIVDNFYAPNGSPANDIDVGDVDNDGFLEIILAYSSETIVYNAISFNREWQAAGFGGDQVKIGNIDNDLIPEILVNGSTAHVLNAVQKSQKWAYSGGFGYDFGVGDVDGDHLAEIAFMSGWDSAFVLDGDTKLIKWQRNDLGDLDAISVMDVNGDGISEVILGNGQWGNVTGYQGGDGTSLWSIHNPEHGVSGIGVGDTNNDGVNEIVWGGGLSSSGKDALFVGDWITQTVEWISDDLDGPLYVAAGDVDLDGQTEIIMASFSTTSGYVGGTIYVYNGLTHELEWSVVISESFYEIFQLAVGQVDNDDALEIIVGGDNWYNARLQVYDGINQTLEWSSPVLSGGLTSTMLVMNLDEDPVDEIIVGLGNGHVQVLNGATPLIEWDSGELNGGILDTSLGDVNGDGVLDLAILTTQCIYVYRVDTWENELQRELQGGRQILIANADLSGPGELIFFTSDSNSGANLQIWDGINYEPMRGRSLGDVEIIDLAVEDLDADTMQEIILMGYSLGTDPRTFLGIGSQNYPFFWEYQLNTDLGIINSSVADDFDSDGQIELLFSGSHSILENEIIPSTVYNQNTFLPVVQKPLPPRGLYGTVTENGIPAAGVILNLRFYNGSSWSTMATATTQNDGTYAFQGMPVLGPNQVYYVQYQNFNGYYPNRLWTWHTQAVDSYNSTTDFNIGNFDVANITLIEPADYATIGLPYMFRWIARPAGLKDNYEFNLYNPSNTSQFFYTDPPLGYVDKFTLNALPTGFRTNTLYAWEIWIYSPNGGFGISYETRGVYFSNTGLKISDGALLKSSKTRVDIETR